MRRPMEPTVEHKSLYVSLLVLTVFFALFEISFFIQCQQAYLDGFLEVSQQLKLPLCILPDIIIFIMIQVMIHGVFCIMTCLTVIGLHHLFIKLHLFKCGILIWFWFLCSIMIANQYSFPNSKFAELTTFFIPDLELLFYSMLVSSSVIILLSLLGYLKKYPRHTLLMFFSCVSIGLFFNTSQTKTQKTASLQYPNIIIIGIDSLRPDVLGFFGSSLNTPFIDGMLAKSTVFLDAVTPLARTFPSWATILSGKHPSVFGVRSNLSSQAHLSLDETLPSILQAKGYFTMYATDESRFSNIDKNFGFDAIVSPPMGINDFLLGSLNDFPISNLLINTSIGERLFPHSYANRGAFFVYDPRSFLTRLKNRLKQAPKNQPLFLGVHFCLPHFPYTWRQYRGDKDSVLHRYQQSVRAVDTQLQQLLDDLAKQGYLKNSIVIMLSDHGEAIELTGDRATQKELFQASGVPSRFYPPAMMDEAFDSSAGHGTDVLGLTQYHTLLAWRDYRSNANGKTLSGLISLEQIRPTILEALKLAGNKDDKSLVPAIYDRLAAVKPKTIFFESDFSPESIRTVYPELSKVFLEGIQLFEADQKNGRLVLKKSMEQMVIKSKQYAILENDWALASYPQNNKKRLSVLVNLKTGLWTTDMTSDFAKSAHAEELLAKLLKFYQQDFSTT